MKPPIQVRYSHLTFQLCSNTGYYKLKEVKLQQTPISRLPPELRIAQTRAPQIKKNADKILLSRTINGKYIFCTGLQETEFENWYLGNDFEIVKGVKIISLILCFLSESDTQLDIYYFYRYDKRTAVQRRQFATEIIPLLGDVETPLKTSKEG